MKTDNPELFEHMPVSMAVIMLIIPTIISLIITVLVCLQDIPELKYPKEL